MSGSALTQEAEGQGSGEHVDAETQGAGLETDVVALVQEEEVWGVREDGKGSEIDVWT